MTPTPGPEREARTARRILRASVVTIVALVGITVLAFIGRNPADQPYEIRGVFSTANQLHSGSDVRVAGITIGEVTRVAEGPGNSSVVTMRIDDAGRPIHRDAELAIRPRLILEGNFFVAVRPGSPQAPELRTGDTIPLTRTSVPVQLDQVLTTFDLATRTSLHATIDELARGLETAPLTATPSPARLPSGQASLRRAVTELRLALPSASRTARAIRGTAPGDLGRAVRSTRDLTTELATDPRALADGVTNFNRVFATLAAGRTPLRATVRSLERLVRVAPASLRAIDRALPTTTRFADLLAPALDAAPTPLRNTAGLLRQLRGLFSARELPAVLGDLAPSLAVLPGLERELSALAPLLTSASRCVSSHVAWTLKQKLEDGANSTGDPVYLDIAHAQSGSGGVVAGFDGNGVALRAGVAVDGTVLDGVIPGLGQVAGTTPKITGVRPVWLGYGVEPAYRPDVPCSEQQRPDLTARSGPPPDLPTGGRKVRVGGILP